jgi:hypothetical protein
MADTVVLALEMGDRLLDMGAFEEAATNFRTAAAMTQGFVRELTSDDEGVSERAAKLSAPDGFGVITFAAAPYRRLCRVLRYRGEVEEALQAGGAAVALIRRLAPGSLEEADALEEMAEAAMQGNRQDLARGAFALADDIRAAAA